MNRRVIDALVIPAIVAFVFGLLFIPHSQRHDDYEMN